MSGSALQRRSYVGMWDCFTGIVRREGVRALYGGCLANTVKIVPSAALQVRSSPLATPSSPTLPTHAETA